MKLLFDGRVLLHSHFTGVENYTKNIYTYLTKKKINISLLKPQSKNKYLSHLWNHFILPFKHGEVLFCPANIAPLFVPKNKKLVVTLHDVAFLTYPESFSFFFRYYYQWLIPKVIQRADKIITVSQASREEIIKYYPYIEEKIEVVFLGLDSAFYVLPHIEKKDQILYVGSLNTRKNFASVIEAFTQIDNDKYQLCIVGNFSPNYKLDKTTQEILDKAQQNHCIHFLSDISDDELRLLYNESKLFLFPSFYEGFGLPVLEAMACATPVVCSNTTSLPEVGGNAAVYCDPHNIEDIKNKIEMVLSSESLQKEMIEKGLQRAKLFTWEKSANGHIEIFNRILEK